jgi:hypothetical protein
VTGNTLVYPNPLGPIGISAVDIRDIAEAASETVREWQVLEKPRAAA